MRIRANHSPYFLTIFLLCLSLSCVLWLQPHWNQSLSEEMQKTIQVSDISYNRCALCILWHPLLIRRNEILTGFCSSRGAQIQKRNTRSEQLWHLCQDSLLTLEEDVYCPDLYNAVVSPYWKQCVTQKRSILLGCQWTRALSCLSTSLYDARGIT